MKPEMCDFITKSHHISEPEDAPKRVRCEKCGRRLKPRLKDLAFGFGWGEESWTWSVPPHKVKKWWKKKTKKKEKGVTGVRFRRM
jgi:hypothetical protein